MQAGINANVIPSSSAVSIGGQLSLSGYNQSISSLTGTGIVTNNSNTSAILTVGDSTSTSFSGQISDTNQGNSGTLALTKTGSGTLTLTVR